MGCQSPKTSLVASKWRAALSDSDGFDFVGLVQLVGYDEGRHGAARPPVVTKRNLTNKEADEDRGRKKARHLAWLGSKEKEDFGDGIPGTKPAEITPDFA